MARFQVRSELETLERARVRLEAALSDDENWRALTQPDALGDDAVDEAARRARDARLERALEANPLYHAWAHVNDAIEALRATGGEAGHPDELAAPLTSGPDAEAAEAASGAGPPDITDAEGPPPAVNGRDMEDLPEDIASFIRRSTTQDLAPSDATDATGHELAYAAEDEAEVEIVYAAAGDDEGKTGTDVTDTPTIPAEAAAVPSTGRLEIPIVPKASAERADAEISMAAAAEAEPAPPAEAEPAPPAEPDQTAPTVEAEAAGPEAPPAAGSETGAETTAPTASELPPVAEDGEKPLPVKAEGANGGAPARGRPAQKPQPRRPEPDEATVTFVLRQPRPSLLPSAELPADLGTERKTPLFERLRGVGEGLEGPDDAFASPDSQAEEAEVVILTPEDLKVRQQAEQRTGNIQRFLKALSGKDPPARD